MNAMYWTQHFISQIFITSSTPDVVNSVVLIVYRFMTRDVGTRVWIKINLFDLIPGSISIFIAQKSYGQDFIIPPLINWDYYLHAITHHHHPNGFLFLWFYHSHLFLWFYLLITFIIIIRAHRLILLLLEPWIKTVWSQYNIFITPCGLSGLLAAHTHSSSVFVLIGGGGWLVDNNGGQYWTILSNPLTWKKKMRIGNKLRSNTSTDITSTDYAPRPGVSLREYTHGVCGSREKPPPLSYRESVQVSGISNRWSAVQNQWIDPGVLIDSRRGSCRSEQSLNMILLGTSFIPFQGGLW